MTRLALIPARGGSKGIPGKNLARVGGMSLLGRAIRCAMDAGIFDAVVVSTDDAAIAEEASRAGASVPFMRPAPLATDTAPVIETVTDALARLEASGAVRFDLVALLEPTSPLRTAAIVRDVVAIAERDPYDAALSVSVVPARFHPRKQFREEADGRLVHVTDDGPALITRQQLTPTFVRNGMCYATRRGALDRGTGVLGNVTGYVLVDGPIVNIDDPDDLELARRLIHAP